MAQNSDYLCLEYHFSSNFGPSQNFRTKKSGPSQNFDTWLIFRAKIKEKLNGSNFGPSQNRMHMPSRDNISFDDFLGHLGDPPVQHKMKKVFFYFYRTSERIKRIVIEIELKMELPQGGTISLKPLSHSCPLHFSLHFFISGVWTASAE